MQENLILDSKNKALQDKLNQMEILIKENEDFKAEIEKLKAEN